MNVYTITYQYDELSPRTDVYINLRDALNDLEEIKKSQQYIHPTNKPMETYKVRIKSDGNVKSYTTNTITLAKITRIADMYELIAPSLGITTDDLQEADKLAKKAINRFFRSVGLVANYIDYTN